jgi:hypothetical protein
MLRAVALVLLLLIAVTAGPAPADAGGTRVIISVGPLAPPPRVIVPPGSQVIINAPSRVFVAPPSQITVNAPSRIIVGPAPVWGPAPLYVYQPRRCVVPGSWAYTWIPQTSTTDVWVDGQYSSDSLWVEGHWAPRVYTSGYYQPYWIPERWTSC